MMKQDDTAIHLRAWHANVGALVADAASMGFHWLYDQSRIAEFANNAPEFHTPCKEEYADKGYFAHANKKPGDLTQYGAQMLALLDSLTEHGEYVESEYIESYRHWFDFGGKWQGYVDAPTKKTLINIHQLEAKGLPFIAVGADDKQNPALSKLPPIVTRYYQEEELLDWVETSVRVTNNNDVAVEYAKGIAVMLRWALLGHEPKECLKVAHRLGGRVAKDIDTVLIMRQSSSREVAQKVGMHCDLDVSFILICHLLFHATNYKQSIRENIYCGGDSSGRAIALGAILGASYQGGSKAIPSDWIEKTDLPQNVFGL
jgi:ADP-ribosylglycohydrolase